MPDCHACASAPWVNKHSACHLRIPNPVFTEFHWFPTLASTIAPAFLKQASCSYILSYSWVQAQVPDRDIYTTGCTADFIESIPGLPEGGHSTAGRLDVVPRAELLTITSPGANDYFLPLVKKNNIWKWKKTTLISSYWCKSHLILFCRKPWQCWPASRRRPALAISASGQ